ncbi:putative MATE family efflux protein [Breznakia pachnodae]|uniref:Probable multidrug resistance protein NorM n=2 Tax=Breznakia pachnodae TaxID=265178 RepID=A0ABU0E0K3_9FIRM|nr:putative MATE family efflux protein [Breznakia pachnodae]
MADTIMISYAGEAAISGVSLVDMINNLIMYVLAAIATGGAVVVSQYLGNKDDDNASLAAGQLIGILVIFSTVTMILCLVFHNALLRLLFGSVEYDVMKAAVTYFIICLLSLPFLGLYNASAALYRSLGLTKVTMYVSLGVNLINIVGNAIGIFVFDAGVAGVAIPTLLSRVFAGIMMFTLAFHQDAIKLKWNDIKNYHSQMVKRILKVALPNGIENGLFHLGKVLVTSIVALFGTTHIAANGVANSIDQIVPIVINAMNLAIITVVGQCIGANEYEQAQYYIKKMMKISYIATFILNVIVFLALPLLLQLYDLSPQVSELTYILVVIHNVLCFLLHPSSFLLSNALRATGDVKVTMYAGIISMLIFRLGSAYLFGIVLDLGVIGVWMAMGMDWLARSIIFQVRYRSGQWMEYRVI